ncbi:MAG: hypothetical protein ACREC3_00160 [Methyloceanibacter sp.]
MGAQADRVSLRARLPFNESVEKPQNTLVSTWRRRRVPFVGALKSPAVALSEPLQAEIVAKLVSDVGIWKIVAHIAFEFLSALSGTFSTASTLPISGRKTAGGSPL